MFKNGIPQQYMALLTTDKRAISPGARENQAVDTSSVVTSADWTLICVVASPRISLKCGNYRETIGKLYGVSMRQL